jgi:hypothetical protein
MQPNVLLIVLDTARADVFEPYGARPEIPVISELARRGSATTAFATASWTLPSHVAMMSGQLARGVGLTQAPGGRPAGCKPRMELLRERMLPEALRGTGYFTGALSTNLWLTPQSGFDLGFDEFETVYERVQPGMGSQSLRGRLRWVLEGVRARSDDGAAAARRMIKEWIGRPHEPFFWFVNLVECHSPYLPPRPYNDLGFLDRARAAIDARRYLSLDAIWKACAEGLHIPSESLERMRHLYMASIRYLDDWIGTLLDDLDKGGMLDETLVVVTSDHGENLGEGGLIGHAFSLDDRLLRVPCVAAGPVDVSFDEVQSLAGLPRVIADALDLESHPWGEHTWPEGVALAQFDPPAGSDDPRVSEMVARWGLGEDALAKITTPLTCATNGRHKLLLRGEKEQLYDLETDPLELNPAAASDGPPQIVARLRDALVAQTDKGPPAEIAGSSAGASAEEVRDLEERMRLLGYL